MTATSSTNPHQAQPLMPGARWAYLVLTGLFAASVAVQVFLAGLGVLVNLTYFGWHTTFAHVLGPLPVALIVTGVLGRVGRRSHGLTLLILVLFWLQYVSIYALQGVPRALYVINALALFWLALHLAQRSWRLIRTVQRERKLNPEESRKGGL